MSTATVTTAYALPVAHPTEFHLAAAVHHVGNVALFLMAPFVGLLYILALPFVGLGLMLIVASRALARQTGALRALKMVAILVAAPFIGLVYAMALPFVGMVMMVRLAYRAYHSHRVTPACCAG